MPFPLQDIDCPLTHKFLMCCTTYRTPPSFNRLSKYCDVIHHCRGFFGNPGWENVQDKVLHYRVRIKAPAPSDVRFVRVLVHFRCPGQSRTCRHCHQTGHLANACHTIICYNCKQTGQLASSCTEPLLRNICKSSEHKARECPYSWLREIDKCTTDQQQHLVDALMLPSVENISTPVSEENSDLENDTKMTEHSQTEVSQTEQSQQNFQKIRAKSSQVLPSIELDP